MNGGDFSTAIHGADLRRLGNIDHAGLYKEQGVRFLPVRLADVAYLLSCQLSVRRFDRQDFMARRFDSARFMVENMGRLRRNDALIVFQAGSDDRKVGLGAADEEIYAGLRSLASLANQVAGMVGMRVEPISRILLQISLGNGFQHRQGRSLQIIAFKSYHLYSSSFIF